MSEESETHDKQESDTMTSPKLGGMSVVRDVIRAHYDLGEVEEPEQLESAHQRRHRKMVVRTSKGKFLAKTYKRDPVVLDALRFQHRLSDHLARNDLPVARIQYAKNGKGIVEVDDWAMELQEFVKGESVRGVSTSSLTASSKALGRFHEVCRDVPVPPRDARLWRFSEVPRESFQDFFDKAVEESSDAEMVEYCNDIAFFLNDAAEELSEEKRGLFETGLMHGDWHGGNLMFRKKKLVAIVDLEFAGDGCYLEDLAYAMSNLCIRTTMNEEKMLLRTNILLDNYQISRSLSYAEQVALYYAVGVKHVTTVSYQVPQLDGSVAGYSAAQWMQRLAAQCKWLEEQAHKSRWGE